jgi:hypothetical protein
MLEDFTVATFSERIGETFGVGEGSDEVELRLVEATPHSSASEEDGRPFSIVFVGPLEPVLPQAIYRFEHDGLGSFDLFIVPIGPGDAAMQYEAVFA